MNQRTLDISTNNLKNFYTCSSGLFSPSVNTKSPHYVYKTHSVSYLALDKHLILGSLQTYRVGRWTLTLFVLAYSRLSLTQVLIMMYTDYSKFNMRRKTWQHRSCCGEKTSLFFMLWFIHHSWLDLILLPPSSCPVYFPQCNLLDCISAHPFLKFFLFPSFAYITHRAYCVIRLAYRLPPIPWILLISILFPF